MKYFTTPAEIRDAWNKAKQGERQQISDFIRANTDLYKNYYFFLCEYIPHGWYRLTTTCGATRKKDWGLRITQIVAVLKLICDCTPRPLPKLSFPKTPPVAPLPREVAKPAKEIVKSVKPPTMKIVGKRFRIR